MRIGILTLRLYDNYGGILQNYALCKVLTEIGHEVVSFHLLKPLSLKRALKKIIFHEKNDSDMLKNKTLSFIQNYIPLTKYKIRYSSQFRIDSRIRKYDAYIVGSDQVWRRPYMEYGLKNMFLGFIKNSSKIKISYAASFGVDDISEYSNKDICKARKYLSSFKGISVRESFGCDICKNLLGVNAIQVLDPTFLLPASHYCTIALSETIQSKGNLLVYFLDETDVKKQILNIITTHENKYIPFYYNTFTNNANAPSVQQWLRGFYDADFILTDSFHGCVFSIIFNKPFAVIGNESRGFSRFSSLLSLFGLEDRLIMRPDYVDKKMLINNIDWKDVNDRLETLRKTSFIFLKQNLSE